MTEGLIDDNDHIFVRQFVLKESKAFANEAFNFMANTGFGDMFFADGDAQSRVGEGIGVRIDRQKGRG